ncbi:MAG: hypothetical protein LW824_09990, partial [Algoriphagus sp.]|nr:hypothetical protein [Algoriphagus sp.]
VVLVAEAEKNHFGEAQSSSSEIETPLPISAPKDQGLYLAFLPINDQNLSLYLINDSRQAYVSHASEVYGTNHRTLYAGTLGAGEVKKIDDRLLQELDEWPSFLLRFIAIQPKLEKAIPAFERQFKLKATQFFKHLSKAPLLGKNTYLFALEQTTKELDIRGLNAELNQLSSAPQPTKVQAPASSIDLHIEAIHPKPDSLSNSEKLRIQLEVFEKNLNQAIAAGMDQITFIHGIVEIFPTFKTRRRTNGAMVLPWSKFPKQRSE